MEFFPEGVVGAALEAVGLPDFSYSQSVCKTVVMTPIDGSSAAVEVNVHVGWFNGNDGIPAVFVGIPHKFSYKPGRYTSASLLGPTMGFSPDMVTKFLTALADAKIADAERLQALEGYFNMLTEAFQLVPLYKMPTLFNVLASVPWLKVGLDKSAQESLVGLVQTTLCKVLERVTLGNREQFTYDFKELVIPRAFDKAHMTANECEFRTELVTMVSASK